VRGVARLGSGAALDVQRGLDPAAHPCFHRVGHDGEEIANALSFALADRSEDEVLERSTRWTVWITNADAQSRLLLRAE